ncbi:hypothetical protein [Streptomyces kanamyceticus]|uniref:Uncharacterized protein n=1 Tax=Streptomyces kanamyceticus TaxID=1967 RepID=A0A5J6GJJ8_STRKN|nr:hypothetical protein [Streptomyces kanamyceticus]QEU94271.1 hypothetical protein CP970_28205 [Streptomyces kanamyceticus]
MRSIAKYVAVGALVTPLVIGSAGFASAHDGGPGYKKSQDSANSSGGMSSSTVSGFTPDGKAYFKTTTKQAGPSGATGNSTGSHS